MCDGQKKNEELLSNQDTSERSFKEHNDDELLVVNKNAMSHQDEVSSSIMKEGGRDSDKFNNKRRKSDENYESRNDEPSSDKR